MRTRLLLAICLMVFASTRPVDSAERLKALIIDGQNNHGAWPKTTFMMKSYLEQTGLFTVEIARTKYTWRGEELLKEYSLPGVKTVPTPRPTPDPDFHPDFSNYDVVVSNFGFGAAPWPKKTNQAFIQYVSSGGGVVIIHAANNSFGDWKEYNEIIGLGGWGGRNESHGPYVYLDENGKLIRDQSQGAGGHHGRQHEFSIVIRNPDHPITRGMPREWMHAKDELYDKLRGPAKNMQILATAFANPRFGGSARHEPMLMAITYGQGRIFHTPMGHADHSQECVGFIVSFQRGAEWAATGQVTQKIPDDFPTAEKVSIRHFQPEK